MYFFCFLKSAHQTDVKFHLLVDILHMKRIVTFNQLSRVIYSHKKLEYGEKK